MSKDRQEFTKQVTHTDIGKTFQTTKLPLIETTLNDRYIFTRMGDRLDNLAFEFYGDPRFWVILATANNLGKGTLVVKPDIQLRIPAKSIVTEYREMLEKAEEER